MRVGRCTRRAEPSPASDRTCTRPLPSAELWAIISRMMRKSTLALALLAIVLSAATPRRMSLARLHRAPRGHRRRWRRSAARQAERRRVRQRAPTAHPATARTASAAIHRAVAPARRATPRGPPGSACRCPTERTRRTSVRRRRCRPPVSMTEAREQAGAFMIPDSGLTSDDNQCAGKCNGKRACGFAGTERTCGAVFCGNMTEQGRASCDGKGHCLFGVEECSAYSCPRRRARLQEDVRGRAGLSRDALLRRRDEHLQAEDLQRLRLHLRRAVPEQQLRRQRVLQQPVRYRGRHVHQGGQRRHVHLLGLSGRAVRALLPGPRRRRVRQREGQRHGRNRGLRMRVRPRARRLRRQQARLLRRGRRHPRRRPPEPDRRRLLLELVHHPGRLAVVRLRLRQLREQGDARGPELSRVQVLPHADVSSLGCTFDTTCTTAGQASGLGCKASIFINQCSPDPTPAFNAVVGCGQTGTKYSCGTCSSAGTAPAQTTAPGTVQRCR